MKYVRYDEQYDGTPQEIAEFLSLRDEQATKYKDEQVANQQGYDPSEFTPLETTISESEMLRKKLAADPNYNPFPGVSPSPDSPVSAELDTGVKFE